MAAMRVSEIMTPEVLTVPPTMPVRELSALLRERRITGAPVVDEAGRVVGVVSEFDLLSRPGATAGDLMSRTVISVGPEADLDEVRRLFVDARIRRVPVLAAGRLVGIVSRGDLLAPAALAQVRGPLDVVQKSALTTGSLDIVQETSEESFPASDPPSYAGTSGDAPPRRG